MIWKRKKPLNVDTNRVLSGKSLSLEAAPIPVNIMDRFRKQQEVNQRLRERLERLERAVADMHEVELPERRLERLLRDRPS